MTAMKQRVSANVIAAPPKPVEPAMATTSRQQAPRGHVIDRAQAIVVLPKYEPINFARR
ncbi:MAG: hypothetical protein U0903_06850 [Planctomycetales bacterium]